ncbi:MAG: Stp1/IreP family PP2C-type Ser/Thr phosphatase [Clostridia bacterium]|nr:Stp1/IreP family PP2C-type Ser/Thr phosphatase [Clostridia bacterium]
MKTYGLSDIGKIRPVNEDSYYLPKDGEKFAIVADGMGGHRAGEIASALAVEIFAQRLSQAPYASEITMLEAVSAANRAVYEAAMSDRARYGMGTTLTAIWFGDTRAFMSHIGDSRAYLFRNNVLMQMSNDHSLVNELIEKGEITPSEARVHPKRNIITRAIGTDKRVVADTMIINLEPNDTWLLCTDGLTNYLRDSDLLDIMKLPVSCEDKLRRMVDLALSRGGSDNITAVFAVNEEAGS